MADEPKTKTEMLRSLRYELMKQYSVFDGSNRLINLYEAPVHVVDGNPCVKTTYEYDGASTRIVKMKEEYATWSSAYDI